MGMDVEPRHSGPVEAGLKVRDAVHSGFGYVLLLLGGRYLVLSKRNLAIISSAPARPRKGFRA
jgi:hypothetical protein